MNEKDKFIESIGNIGESIGLNRTVCQIYALLYLNPEPLSPASIGKLLSVSKGNISINMKKLEEWNAVKKIWKKGYSRSFYTANEDIESIIFDRLKTGLKKRNNQLKKSLTEIKKSLRNTKKKDEKELNTYYSVRIKQFEIFMKDIELFFQNLDVLKSFLTK